MYFNPHSIPRNPAIEIDNHEIVEIEAGESIEVGESADAGRDNKSFNANTEDDELVHEEQVEEHKDDDDQEKWQKAMITKSGRVSGHGVRFADKEWTAEQ
eukprot:4173922-Ditylum_brightwellii.AAC.1